MKMVVGQEACRCHNRRVADERTPVGIVIEEIVASSFAISGKPLGHFRFETAEQACRNLAVEAVVFNAFAIGSRCAIRPSSRPVQYVSSRCEVVRLVGDRIEILLHFRGVVVADGRQIGEHAVVGVDGGEAVATVHLQISARAAVCVRRVDRTGQRTVLCRIERHEEARLRALDASVVTV